MTPEETHLKIQVINKVIQEIAMKLFNYKEFVSEKNDTLFGIRDSLAYRARSVAYHLHAIQANLEYANDILHQDLQDNLTQKLAPKFHEISTSTTEALLFLLDDLIFSAASYYDYLAKLFFYCLIGEHQMRWDWKKLTIKVKDNKIRVESNLSKLIFSENDRFIRPLHEHRSNLIHNKKDTSNAQEIYRWTPELFNRELKPTVPDFFSESFLSYSSDTPSEKQNLVYATEWLANEFFKSIICLITKLNEVCPADYNRES